MRLDTDELFEAVLIREELESLIGCLGVIFGQSFFPPQSNFRRAGKITEEYGGIQHGQTLYYLEDESIIAMLWPWGDGINITFKLIKKPE